MKRESSGSPIFEARSLGVSVGGMDLLADITIVIEEGGRLLLSGPSGSGKSSLLRVLAGLDAASCGSLSLQGRTPESWGWPCYRRHVNLLFQRPLLFERSLSANLELPFQYSSAAGDAFPSDRATELLEALGLSAKRLDEDPRSFSVGEQQRVCLIRSLLTEPDLLLMDEPTSALDMKSASSVLDLIERESRERGMAVILSGHDHGWAGDSETLDILAYRVGSAS